LFKKTKQQKQQKKKKNKKKNWPTPKIQLEKLFSSLTEL
jgi:hypothetical protein